MGDLAKAYEEIKRLEHVNLLRLADRFAATGKIEIRLPVRWGSQNSAQKEQSK